MRDNYLISSSSGERLYRQISKLPIIDYHCHLSPREIYEDKPFTDIARIWLEHDHYKWRLMRSAGIDEEDITGGKPWEDKFKAYAAAAEYAAGSPLYHWNTMELDRYFGIDEPLTRQNAAELRERANRCLSKTELSPRSAIVGSGVEYIATTDDICDSLEWHRLLAGETDPDTGRRFPVRVVPSFRTDRLLLIRDKGWRDYSARLSTAVGFDVRDISSFAAAVSDRLDFFVSHGCVMTDVGIAYFPDRIYNEAEAGRVLALALEGERIPDGDFLGFLGYMFVFLAGLYRERGLVMQWHTAVHRNASTRLLRECGADAGGDCIGEAVPGRDIIALLDAVDEAGGLPETLIYSLNPAGAAELSSVCGCFRHVRPGAAWWFCDHKRGIAEQLNVISETGNLSAFPGMLTDSRSFLSFARHDYFRRILADLIGHMVDNGEFPEEAASALAAKLSYTNPSDMVSLRR